MFVSNHRARQVSLSYEGAPANHRPCPGNSNQRFATHPAREKGGGDHRQGPTSTLYSNRTRIFLSYSNPTRKFLKNDRVASSVYYSHFRKIAARPASQYYSFLDTALVEILSFILSLTSATYLVFYIIFNFSNKQNTNVFSIY